VKGLAVLPVQNDCLFDNPAQFVKDLLLVVAVTPPKIKPGALPT
jgi:hypothetical protein